MCLFEASNPELVKQLNDEAKIPYTRVIEVADFNAVGALAEEVPRFLVSAGGSIIQSTTWNVRQRLTSALNRSGSTRTASAGEDPRGPPVSLIR